MVCSTTSGAFASVGLNRRTLSRRTEPMICRSGVRPACNREAPERSEMPAESKNAIAASSTRFSVTLLVFTRLFPLADLPECSERYLDSVPDQTHTIHRCCIPLCRIVARFRTDHRWPYHRHQFAEVFRHL